MSLRILKSIFLGLIFLGNSIAMANSYGIYETHPYEFVIKKRNSKYAETYSIYAPKVGSATYPATYPGTVKKSAFRIRTHYDLSNKNGWQATGITRLLSMGIAYSWATDIDIYDTRGVKIGMIDGNIATLESAKFNIYSYDEAGHATEVGVALANADFTHFSITTPENYLPIADLARDVTANNWTVSVITPEIIDDRIMRIFAGFVVNFQDKFMVAEEVSSSVLP